MALSMSYQTQTFEYTRHVDQSAVTPKRHKAVIVGAGPVGLTLALDLAQKGVKVVVLDDDYRLSTGSRAICFAKRTLEIFDRLGIGQRCVDKGVSWNVGKVFLRDQQLYEFNLLSEHGHQRPAFINLQQYYVEGFLNDAVREHTEIDLRWKNRVSGLVQQRDHVTLSIDTPDGAYQIEADYVIACDGSRSPVRQLIGQKSKGQVFKDRFLIADVKMTAPFPTERWFWFDPPFHPNQSVLLHKQPDDVWRIDFQLGWDADPDEEKKPENILPRVRALLGEDAPFTLEWVSVYTFACMRMEKFRYGRVLFVGDSAHGVSPFGARGANSGIQDADNLGWKLAAVLHGEAQSSLLDSYCVEREYAADENIMNSTRSTDFITPKSDVSRLFRDAVLELAKDHPFARRIVNSGRLSMPSSYTDSSLNTPDEDSFSGSIKPGSPAIDAPVSIRGEQAWFLPLIGGEFTMLVVQNDSTAYVETLSARSSPSKLASQTITPSTAWLERYDATPCTTYLFRPDQHVCARWRQHNTAKVRAAILRATGAIENNAQKLR
jgi:3-(3-hydroxy-phenyl)propionate hydroxylase